MRPLVLAGRQGRAARRLRRGLHHGTRCPSPPRVEPAPEPGPFPGHLREGVPLRREPEQLTLAAAAPRKPRREEAHASPAAPVPLKDFEDWLEFAESVLGRQDIPADSLAGHFTTLSDLSDYEDQLEIYMGMDPFYRLAERFPWLDTVADIAAQQGFFHWELRFAQVFADGGFDLQLGNPPWVRPDWEENVVLAEFDPWFELAEKPSSRGAKRARQSCFRTKRLQEFFLAELTGQAAWETFFGTRYL